MEHCLKTIREQLCFSQATLAERIGVSKRMVTYYESGDRRPSPQVAEKIGKELGLTREELWEMFYGQPVGEQKSAG